MATAARGLSQPEGVWYAPRVTPEPATTAIRPADADPDPRIRPMFDAPSIDSPTASSWRRSGLPSTRLTPKAASRSSTRRRPTSGVVDPRSARNGAARGSCSIPTVGRCPRRMPDGDRAQDGAIIRGFEGIAERPDGTRAAFIPYPTASSMVTPARRGHQHAGRHHRAAPCRGCPPRRECREGRVPGPRVTRAPNAGDHDLRQRAAASGDRRAARAHKCDGRRISRSTRSVCSGSSRTCSS